MKQDPLANRKLLFYVLITIVFLIFTARLFQIQIIDDSYKLSSQNNVVRSIVLYPERGYIYDRNGNLLVANQPAFDVMILPKELKNIDTTELCADLNITKQEFLFLDKNIRKKRSYSKHRPNVFMKDISSQTYASFQSHLYKYKGVYIQEKTLRHYLYPNAGNVVGFIREVPDATISENAFYKKGDQIGASGIEKSYEEHIRGERGVKRILVDVFNNQKGSFGNGKYDTLPSPGKAINSTIDINLQQYGELLMKNKSGSIVAIEPSTGEILALVTSPNYDPNLLVGANRSKNYNKLYKNESKPLYDRSILAEYPPGSTFKLINALIALQEGVVNPSTKFACDEGYHYKNTLSIGCHEHRSPLNLQEAIANSCNAYFCNTFKNIFESQESNQVAYTLWYDYVTRFGLGNYLNNDLPTGKKGFVPDLEYFNSRYRNWGPTYILSMSIGQGELLTTPIQLANMTASIANKGYYYTPHIVRNQDLLDSNRFAIKHLIPIKEEYFEIVINAMQMVVEDKKIGSAYNIKSPMVTICGKTGTVQNPHGKDHSVFIAFAPKENPKIALAVVVENAGWGSEWAAPIAGLMIEKYLVDSISKPYIENYIINRKLQVNASY